MKISRLFFLILLLVFATSCSAPFGGNKTRVKRERDLSIGSNNRVDDMARFLAGMPGGSHYAQLRKTPAWQSHKSKMDSLFRTFDSARGGPILKWNGAISDVRSNVVFYPFGGPDFAFANAFFPGANTYILCGLEGANYTPDPNSISSGEVSSGLSNLHGSLYNIVHSSYFITKKMRSELSATRFNGTMPIVLTFLARSGHRIQSIEMIDLSSSGGVTSRSGSGGAAPGYHIVARGGGGGTKHIYYFNEDLSNGTQASDPRLLRFVASKGTPVTYLKSASYLMHNSSFSAIRNGILRQSSAVVTDPSGVPFRHFDGWNVRLYGQYTGTLDIFSEHYQADLAAAYKSGYKVAPMPFGVGYKQTCLIVAKKR